MHVRGRVADSADETRKWLILQEKNAFLEGVLWAG
jgi:hypothetical protein